VGYPDNAQAALSGCYNDGKTMATIAERRYGAKDITILTDEPGSRHSLPTADNIRDSLRRLALQARRGKYTHLFVTYSGHGSSVRDRGRDEADGRDEVLVPCDYQRAGCVTDDWIHRYFLSVLPAGLTCLMVFDMCHSGTILDLDSRGAVQANVIGLSGCCDDQTSVEAYNLHKNSQWSGALTTTFKSLVEANPDTRVGPKEANAFMLEGLKALGMEQTPQLHFCGEGVFL
jgi:hypothetical protein